MCKTRYIAYPADSEHALKVGLGRRGRERLLVVPLLVALWLFMLYDHLVAAIRLLNMLVHIPATMLTSRFCYALSLLFAMLRKVVPSLVGLVRCRAASPDRPFIEVIC